MMQDHKPENDPVLPEEDDFDDEFLDTEFGDDLDEDFVDDLGDDYADDGSAGMDEPLSGEEMNGGADDLSGEMDYVEEEFDDDDWEDEEDFDSELAGAGAQKPKKEGLNLSFNTIAISLALIAGVCVLAYQVITKKPDIMDTFTTALSMTGATSGPVFEKDGAADTGEEVPVPTPEEDTSNQGFLNKPEILDNEVPPPSVDGAPPMPSSIGTPEEDVAQDDAVLTPMPDQFGDEEHVPRAPDQAPPAPSYSIDARVDDQVAADQAAPAATAPAEQSAEQPATPNKAEDMLKNALAAREQKKAEEAQAQQQSEELPVPEQAAIPAPTPEPVAEAPAPAVPATPAAVPAPQNDAATAQLAGKLDTLLDRLGGMESRIDEINKNSDQKIAALRDEIKNEMAGLKQEMQSAVQNAPAPAATSEVQPSVSEEKLNAMREEMRSAFEQELSQAKAEMKKEVEAAKEAARASAPAPAAAPPVKQAEAEKPAAAAPAPAKKAPAAKPAPKKAAAPAATTSRTAWVLKAAKPGKAWVSPAGQNTIRGVSVGESLEGIGKITAITFTGGRWIIQGTNGQIRQ